MSYIYELVDELAEKYKTREPFELCERLGIMVMVRNDFLELKGMFAYVFNEPVILVSGKEDERVQRLVCAHELGHYFLHSEIAKKQCLQEFAMFGELDRTDRTEYEANTFAAHLLIEDNVMDGYLRDGYDVFETAGLLDVNVHLLNIKMTDLNRMGCQYNLGWSDNKVF